MPLINRRELLLSLPAALIAAPARAADGPISSASLLKLWQRSFASSTAETFCWWGSGVMFAHVDGLREFPVLGLHTLTVGHMTADTMQWRTLGFFTDLASARPATSWYNVFTDRREPVPQRFTEGPGSYRAQLTNEGIALHMEAAHVRINRVVLTGVVAEQRLELTQVESTLQGLPALDGELPALDSPEVTERQSRLQWFLPVSEQAASELTDSTAQTLWPKGYYNRVYDSMPLWLGFGERLGNVVIKGQLHKTPGGRAGDTPLAKQFRKLFSAAWRAGRWQV
jgi:hypothetical protein